MLGQTRVVGPQAGQIDLKRGKSPASKRAENARHIDAAIQKRACMSNLLSNVPAVHRGVIQRGFRRPKPLARSSTHPEGESSFQASELDWRQAQGLSPSGNFS